MAAALKKVRISGKPVATKVEDSSEDELSGSDSGSDSALDEFAGESSSDDGYESSDVDEAEDDEFVGEAEDRPKQVDGKNKLEDAMSAILGSKIKAHDRDNPVLVRNKRMAKEIEEAKLDAQTRRQLRAEKLQSQDRARVKDIVPADPDEAGRALQQEKRYKKTAQRGVVRLMNALRASQSAATTTLATTTSIGVDKKTQEVATASKDSFLDMIRSG